MGAGRAGESYKFAGEVQILYVLLQRGLVILTKVLILGEQDRLGEGSVVSFLPPLFFYLYHMLTNIAPAIIGSRRDM